MSILLVPLIWILDQWTKRYAQENLRNAERRYYLEKKLSLGYVENHGAFLGWLKDNPKLLHGLTVSAIVLISILAIPYWFMGRGHLSGIALALILAGALGNYTDRVKDGYVTDFVAFAPKHKVHFNIADFAIFGGALLIILVELTPLK